MKNAFKTALLFAVIVHVTFFNLACSKQGDIPNGRYEFHSLTIGDTYINASDTPETIKPKLLAEFPDFDNWDYLMGKYGQYTQLEFYAQYIMSYINSEYFFEVNENRISAKWNYVDAPTNNERYRLEGNEIMLRSNKKWEAALGHLYENETFYRDWDWHFTKKDLSPLVVKYRVNYKTAPT